MIKKVSQKVSGGFISSFSTLYAVILEDLDLTIQQYALLNVLDEHENICMREVSDLLRMSEPAVTFI